MIVNIIVKSASSHSLLSNNFLNFRHSSDRSFPAIHEPSSLPGRVRHLLREDRVRARAETELQPAGDLLQQLQPLLPPKAIPLLQIQAPEFRTSEKATRITPRPGSNHLQKIRLPLPGDARQFAMPARRHVRRKREQARA